MSFIEWLERDSDESVGATIFLVGAGMVFGHLAPVGSIIGLASLIGVEYFQYRKSGDLKEKNAEGGSS